MARSRIPTLPELAALSRDALYVAVGIAVIAADQVRGHRGEVGEALSGLLPDRPSEPSEP